MNQDEPINETPEKMPSEPREFPNHLTAEGIADILPHRYPFALVDQILDYEPGKWAIGIKCVSRRRRFCFTPCPSSGLRSPTGTTVSLKW